MSEEVGVSLEHIIAAAVYEKKLIRIRTSSDAKILEMWGGKFSRSQTVAKIREDAQNPDARIIETKYRPFDQRWVFYTGLTDGIITNPRRDTMRHFLPGDYGYYVNRTCPTDRYSTPLDFKVYDHFMEPLIDRDDATYLANHPFFGACILKLRQDQVNGILPDGWKHSEIFTDTKVSTALQTNEPRDLIYPLSFYNKGHYPQSQSKILDIETRAKQGALL